MGLLRRRKKVPTAPGIADGRKYRLALICLLVLLAGFGVGGLSPVFVKLYPDLITAVLGVLFLYCGGNVANKWSVGKKDGLTVAQNGQTITQGPPPSVGVR